MAEDAESEQQILNKFSSNSQSNDYTSRGYEIKCTCLECVSLCVCWNFFLNFREVIELINKRKGRECIEDMKGRREKNIMMRSSSPK